MAGIPEGSGTLAVAGRLRLTREALGLKKAPMSRLVGVSQQAWGNCEEGARRISVDQAIKICIATGATLDWIYRGELSAVSSGLAEKIQKKLRSLEPKRRATA